MDFKTAVTTVLSKYADPTGRARRSEYWWFLLAYVLAYVVAAVVDSVLGVPLLTLIVSLGALLPSIMVSIRRLHDTNRSGWWLLIGLVPLVGGIVLLVFAATEGQRGGNSYGADPKQVYA